MRFSDAFAPGTAIEAGWNALKRAPWPLLVGSVLLVMAGSQCGLESEDWREVPRWAWDVLGLVILSGGFLGLLFFLLKVFITPGYLRVAGRAIFGQRPAFERLFGSGDRFLDMLLWVLLRYGILAVSGLLLLLPLLPLGLYGGIAALVGSGRWDHWEGVGIAFGMVAALYGLFFALPVLLYVELGLYFGRFLVALEGKGPVDALKTSWSLASGHRWWLSFFRLVMFFVAAAGVFALLIGYFVTRSIADAGSVGAFLAWRRGSWPPYREESLAPAGVAPQPPDPDAPDGSSPPVRPPVPGPPPRPEPPAPGERS